jgi:hypothetical protein
MEHCVSQLDDRTAGFVTNGERNGRSAANGRFTPATGNDRRSQGMGEQGAQAAPDWRLPLLAGRSRARTRAEKARVASLKRTAELAGSATGLACVSHRTTAPATTGLTDQLRGGARASCGRSRAATGLVQAATTLAGVAARARRAPEARPCADSWVAATGIADRAACTAVGHAGVGRAGAATKAGRAWHVDADTGVVSSVAATAA